MTIIDPAVLLKVLSKGDEGEEGERVELGTRLESFIYTDDEKKADILKLKIDNKDLSQFDNGIWERGQVLNVAWGYVNALTTVRSVVIKKASGYPTLEVEAHAKSVLMDKEIKSRVFEDMSHSEIVKEIAEENGYKGNRAIIDDTKVKIRQVNQAGLTDAQFLKHLANREGFEFYVDFDGLHWHERKLDQRPVRVFTYYNDPVRNEILAFQPDGDITKRPTRVKLQGRDPLKKQDIDVEASNEDTNNRAALGDVMEAIDLKTGESLGDRMKNTSHDETLPTTETDEDAAKRVADGRFKRAALNTIKVKITVIGDPDVVAKTVIELRGLGKKFSGKYYVSSVESKIEGGFLMDLNCKRDGSGLGTGISGTSGVPSAGKKNNQEASENDVEPIEKINLKTGESKGVEFRDTKGRSN